MVSRVHYWKSGRTIGGKALCSYSEPWVITDAPLKARVVFHSLPLLCSSLVVRRAGELCRMPLLYSVASYRLKAMKSMSYRPEPPKLGAKVLLSSSYLLQPKGTAQYWSTVYPHRPCWCEVCSANTAGCSIAVLDLITRHRDLALE